MRARRGASEYSDPFPPPIRDFGGESKWRLRSHLVRIHSYTIVHRIPLEDSDLVVIKSWSHSSVFNLHRMSSSQTNSNCVGPQSDEAGKVDSCAGCPNQQACASGEAKNATDNAAAQFVKDRMAAVKHKILILSGKM